MKYEGKPKTTWVFLRWFDYDFDIPAHVSVALLSFYSGRWNGEWEVSSWVRIWRSVSVKLKIPSRLLGVWPGTQVSCLARRWQSANMSPMSVVVTQHIRDLITPQYQTETAANMSQLPSGVMQRNRLLWCWLAAMAGNQIQPRYNCFQPKHLDTTPPSLMKTTQTEERR